MYCFGKDFFEETEMQSLLEDFLKQKQSQQQNTMPPPQKQKQEDEQ